MTPEARLKLKQLLIQHEGMELNLYTDTTGNQTIGVGHNLSSMGISQNIALAILDEDIFYFYSKLLHYCDFFPKLNENRQIALVDMAFNLGIQGFMNFKEMLTALESHDYERAANDMLASKWAGQVHERATTLANIIRTGNI